MDNNNQYTATQACLSKDLLIKYSKATASAAEERQIEEHIASCALCSDAVDSILSLGINGDKLFDIENPFEKINNNTPIEVSHNKKNNNYKIAAALLVLLGAASLIGLILKNNKKENLAIKSLEKNNEVDIAENNSSNYDSTVAISNTQNEIISNTTPTNNNKVDSINKNIKNKANTTYIVDKCDDELAPEEKNEVIINKEKPIPVAALDENKFAEEETSKIQEPEVTSNKAIRPRAENKKILADNYTFKNIEKIKELINNKKYNEAVVLLEKENNKTAEVYYYLNICYTALGKKEEAIKAIKKAKELGWQENDTY
jgi:tetratricopeptide (TPR) repeat protein